MSSLRETSSGRELSFAGLLIVGLVRTVFIAVVIAVPLLGVWIATSLAAYHDAPMWTVWTVAALAFPILPLAWEGISALLRKRQRYPQPRGLTFFDRLTLRTFVVDLTVLIALLVSAPSAAFTSLSVRGDWMLDELEGPQVEEVRRGLFWTAQRLEWLWELSAAEDNPYEELVDEAKVRAPPSADELGSGGEVGAQDSTRERLREHVGGSAVDPKGSQDAGVAEIPGLADPRAWPFEDAPHPLVVEVPEQAEASIETLARYVADNEPDPYLRVKALHDWVALNIAYDVPSYRSGNIPPQGAQTTFETRLSVCAGYANLLAALGEYSGDEIVVVSGWARPDEGETELDGTGHAWNAARIEGRWYLIDATWDAGSVNGDAFTREYESSYFLTPPEVFGISHFPRDPGWQLVAEPIERGEFIRLPELRPGFFARGLRLRSPTRAQVGVSGLVFEIEFFDPLGAGVEAQFEPAGGGQRGFCERDGLGPRGGPVRRSTCELPGPGIYEVMLFAPSDREPDYFGKLRVVAGG